MKEKSNLLHRWFDLAVNWLHIMADSLGISYEEMNIWLYVIVQPIVTIVLGISCWRLYYLNRKKKKELVALFQQKKNENSIN